MKESEEHTPLQLHENDDLRRVVHSTRTRGHATPHDTSHSSTQP